MSKAVGKVGKKHAAYLPKPVAKAAEVAGMGHSDMIDNIPYSDSATNRLKFLTVDQELGSFVRKHGLEDTTVFPSEVRTFL
ncbi:MAG: hypothetical protein JRN45_10905 [Nitrososphaerota archaeon]|nr:hypothetical protein [Nitrososphaerota archaeon]